MGEVLKKKVGKFYYNIEKNTQLNDNSQIPETSQINQPKILFEQSHENILSLMGRLMKH